MTLFGGSVDLSKLMVAIAASQCRILRQSGADADASKLMAKTTTAKLDGNRRHHRNITMYWSTM